MTEPFNADDFIKHVDNAPDPKSYEALRHLAILNQELHNFLERKNMMGLVYKEGGGMGPDQLKIKLRFVTHHAYSLFLHYPVVLRGQNKSLKQHVTELVDSVMNGRNNLLHYHPDSTNNFDDITVQEIRANFYRFQHLLHVETHHK